MARGRYNRRHTGGVLRKKFAMRQLKARTARKGGAPRHSTQVGAQSVRPIRSLGGRSGSTGITRGGSRGARPSTYTPGARTAISSRTSTTATRGPTSSASTRPRKRRKR